jgi:hypothetical protein
MLHAAKDILKYLAPNGVIEARHKRYREQKEAERLLFHQARRERIARASAAHSGQHEACMPEFEEIIGFLMERGIPEEHLRDGSIPPDSLEFIHGEIAGLLPPAPANGYRGLHVGNFVGVSLASLTGMLATLSSSSVVVSIDPNLTHRGIEHPQDHVMALLSRFRLQNNSLVIGGYSTAKSISNDGVTFEGYDPADAYAAESACENCLSSLVRLGMAPFHVALVDGNHEGDYVARELRALAPLLAEGAVLIMDDVNGAWDEIASLFASLDQFGFVAGATDGRVGLATFHGANGPGDAAHRKTTRGKTTIVHLPQ